MKKIIFTAILSEARGIGQSKLKLIFNQEQGNKRIRTYLRSNLLFVKKLSFASKNDQK